MDDGWVRAIDTDALRTRGRTVFRHEGRQIAVFSTPNGPLACNNRCPHEGFPLLEGTLDGDCVLTCNWHNWKFDLRTGANQRDGDRLRVYPTEVRGDGIWLRIVDPPVEHRVARTMDGLKDGFGDHDRERLAREIARLMQLGADPVRAVSEAIRWSHDRLEFGWTHAFAGAADWLALHDRHAGNEENRLICLLEAVAHMSEDVLREERYPYPEGALDWDEDAFVAAVEAEDETAAIRFARGAMASPGGFQAVERGLARAALAHYADFGHSAIYVHKAGELVSRLGTEAAEPVLLPLVRSLVTAFREDLIPEFRNYGDALQRMGTTSSSTPPDASRFRTCTPARAMELAAGCGTARPVELFRILLEASAVNMLALDLEHLEDLDQPYGNDIGWLDMTHALTFADAVLGFCRRWPDLWPAALLQMACFAARNGGHQDAQVTPRDWMVGDQAAFFRSVEDRLLDHGQEAYIVSVHLLKTTMAIRALADAPEAGNGADLAVAALNRMLNSPIRRRMVRRTARQALRFVAVDI